MYTIVLLVTGILGSWFRSKWIPKLWSLENVFISQMKSHRTTDCCGAQWVWKQGIGRDTPKSGGWNSWYPLKPSSVWKTWIPLDVNHDFKSSPFKKIRKRTYDLVQFQTDSDIVLAPQTAPEKNCAIPAIPRHKPYTIQWAVKNCELLYTFSPSFPTNQLNLAMPKNPGLPGSLYDTNPNFMHYYSWKITQKFHTFALFDTSLKR